MLGGPLNEVHDVIFKDINEELIQKAAKRARGTAGQSKFDAGLRHILVSNVFGKHSVEHYESLARMTKSLCTNHLRDYKRLKKSCWRVN